MEVGKEIVVTDIHFYVEKYQKIGDEIVTVDINGFPQVQESAKTWVSIDKWTQSTRFVDFLDVSFNDSFLAEENHAIFALLAGVCNDENTKPIDEPRGLPLDLSLPVAKIAKLFTERGFCEDASWFTLDELLRLDLDDLFKDRPCGVALSALYVQDLINLVDKMRFEHCFPSKERASVETDAIRFVFWFD